MLVVKNGDIFNARGPLQELIAIRLPVLTSYRLALMTNKLNEQLVVMEDVRRGLIQQYGTPDEGGRNLSVPEDSENYPAFMGEFSELMAVEVKIALEKVVLPQKVSATCDVCHHNMDRDLEIESRILLALIEFVEVAE